MVKIIKPGLTQDPREAFPYNTTLTCPRCRCEFRLEPGDQWQPHDDQRDGPFITTKCPQPQCGETVTRAIVGAWRDMADPKWRPADGDSRDLMAAPGCKW